MPRYQTIIIIIQNYYSQVSTYLMAARTERFLARIPTVRAFPKCGNVTDSATARMAKTKSAAATANFAAKMAFAFPLRRVAMAKRNAKTAKTSKIARNARPTSTLAPTGSALRSNRGATV